VIQRGKGGVNWSTGWERVIDGVACCAVPEDEYFSAGVDRHDRLIEDGDAKYREAGRTGVEGRK
jgi:hypothetical protein